MKEIKVPFELAGAGIRMGLIGEALDSEGLKQRAAIGNFIAPAINIMMGGYIINKLKELKNTGKVQEKKEKKVI